MNKVAEYKDQNIALALGQTISELEKVRQNYLKILIGKFTGRFLKKEEDTRQLITKVSEDCAKFGIEPLPEIFIPLTDHDSELFKFYFFKGCYND